MKGKLEVFKHLLELENKKQNLVSRKTEEEGLDQHIADSRKVLDYYDLTGKKVTDIGSGAGFPGVIMALLCPQAEYLLIETDLKKSRFLNEIKKQLDLQHVTIINERVETVGQNLIYRGQYDVCTARAVAALKVLLEYGMPLLKINGKMIFWKGKKWRDELNEAQSAMQHLRGEHIETHAYELENGRTRVLMEIEKKAATPDKYPRRVGIPAKRPL